MCLKRINHLPFCVCFSFCPNGETKSVLIAQTHRQKVILYLPSVVPSFVYLLLNCLRGKTTTTTSKTTTTRIQALKLNPRQTWSFLWSCEIFPSSCKAVNPGSLFPGVTPAGSTYLKVPRPGLMEVIAG